MVIRDYYLIDQEFLNVFSFFLSLCRLRNNTHTQIAFRRLCASGMVGSFSLDDGNNDQKKSFHSSSSCIYGMILVNNLTQFNAEIEEIN